MKLKKLTAQLLAFCLVMNSFAFVYTEQAFAAATVSLIADMTKRLTENPAAITPVDVTQDLPADQTYVFFPVTEGKYTLQYIIDDYTTGAGYVPKKIEVTVEKDINNIYHVDYNVNIFNSGTNTFVPYTTSPYPYNIYAFNKAGGRGYTVYTDYIANYNNNGNTPDQMVVNTPTPNFSVGANRGYSFQYDNATVHFKVDGSGRLVFATNSTKIGGVYEFKLSNNTTIETSTVTVNTGFDLKVTPDVNLNTTVTPTANNGLTASTADELDITPPVIDTNPDNKRLPGSKDVGITFKIPMPKVWNGTNKFEQAAPPSGANAVLPATFKVGYDIQIVIPNIWAPPANPSVNPGNGATCSAQIITEGTDKYLQLKVGNLPPNTVYDGSSIVIGGTDVTRKTRASIFPNSSVFTFVQYEIVPKNGKYYALVKPYKKPDGTPVDGYYLLTDGMGSRFVMQRGDGVNDTLIPLTVSPENQNVSRYQVLFSPGNASVYDSPQSAIYSQRSVYKADLLDVVSTPNSFTVTDATIVPTEPDLSRGDLTMTLDWDIGDAASILRKVDVVANANGQPFSIVYKLQYTMTPDNNPPFTDFAYALISIRKDPSDITKYQIKYDNFDYRQVLNLTTQPAYLLPFVPTGKVESKDWHELKTPTINDDPARVGVKGLQIQAPSSAKPGPQYTTDPDTGDRIYIQFYYPEIYFLNTQPLLQTDIANPTNNPTKVINTSPSLCSSMTLSDISKLTLPPPQDLTLEFGDITPPDDEISFHAKWSLSGKGVKDFLDNSYGFKTKPFIAPKMYMNLYLSQDNEYMMSSLPSKEMDYKNAENPPTEAGIIRGRQNAPMSVLFNYVPSPSNRMIFSNDGTTEPINLINGENPIPRDVLRKNKVAAVTIELTDEDVQKLVAGQSVAYDYILDGLDKNQKYYAYVDLFVKSNTQSPDWNSTTMAWYASESKLSSIATITTKGVLEVPKPSDKIPPAPQNLGKKDVGLDHATIFWDKVPLDAIDDQENDKIEYEIIRVTNNQIPNDSRLLESREAFTALSASKLWTDIKDEKIALRTKDGTPVNLFGITDLTKFVLDDSDNVQYFLTDKSLTPNTLYFYYVRTVKIIDGIERYSTWSAVSVTTLTVQAPKNLKAETGRKDYDTQKEIWISFDAPIDNKDNVGVIANLQYQIKKDTDSDWPEPVTMDVEMLKQYATAASEAGWTHFLYKITGLQAGTTYQIRVAMVDIATKDVSVYSNIATFRTEMNQQDYDDSLKEDDWLGQLKEELSKLYKFPYWTGANNPSNLEIIYRPGAFEASMRTLTDSRYSLVESASQRAVYFIPVSCYDAATKANVGFTVNHGNLQAVIPPGAIDLNTNPAIFAVSEQLKRGKADGYFVRIAINWLTPPESIDGEAPITDVCEVRYDIVASKMNIGDWDSDLFAKVLERIDAIATAQSYKDQILRMVKDKALSEEFSLFVSKIIADAGASVYNIAHENLLKTLDTVYPLSGLDKEMAIAVKGIDTETKVAAYRNENGGWFPYTVTPLGQNKAIYTKNFGAYVFTGRLINIPGIENVQKGQTAIAIVSKYGLDDFLGKDKIILEANATKQMVAGSVARMMGAPKGSDIFDWLKSNKKINVSSRGQNSNATLQESLYLMMALFEAKTGTSIANLKIRDNTALSGVTGLEEKYAKSVRAAYELDIYRNKNMVSNGPLTIEEMLNLLTKIDNKKKL